ncbi:pyridine nucleotide-disulfide oxidoreductase-domain-containing protein [Colletotrichum sp. SAR 10_66]|nr:pyridine nucleotide-disulfide oxidoreductase-domain-containing protein [Colletotrichum sp. SAR 10_76]KAJ5001399.1 pyridine nucleotide-disulfide oxidoreductase-domain-containing protein [Colletotrichum sp. SAR 10_66]
MAESIKADYLVIGTGGMGMAFVDTLLSDTHATVALVDRYSRPGGHWTTAYSFVRLHQPSAFYGVNSKKLGNDMIDKVGWNKGLHELATSDEVLSYYDQVLNQHFLPSGRVQYFPNCSYEGEGKFVSMLSGKSFQMAGSSTRIVDSTYMRVKVPSMGPPAYQVASGVPFVTPNSLSKVSEPFANFTIVGAGKTGIDACLWLLSRGIDASKLTWIMPRDSWLFDRSESQPGPEFAERSLSVIPTQIEAIMAATSVNDLLKRLERAQHLMRISDDVWPTMFRCASVSVAEFEQLKKITNIVRQGRVASIGLDEVKFDNGSSYQPQPKTLFVDCTADGLQKREAIPVFNGNLITLQAVRACQQVFSAAFIAHVEAAYSDDEIKNKLCRPIPHPDQDFDWLLMTCLNLENTMRWHAQPETTKWLSQARLDWVGAMLASPNTDGDSEKRQDLMQAMTPQIHAACEKLKVLLAQLPPKDRERIKAQIIDA